MKQTLCALALTSLPALAHAETTVAELNGNQELQTLDLKLGGELPAGFNYFTRTRFTVLEEDEVGAFALAKVMYPLAAGFAVISENQFSPKLFRPGFGMQYTLKGDNIGFIVQAHANANPQPHQYTDVSLMSAVQWTPTIAGEQWLVMAEATTTLPVVKEGATPARTIVERARLGWKPSTQYSVGAGIDFKQTEIPGMPQTDYQPLLFGRKDF